MTTPWSIDLDLVIEGNASQMVTPHRNVFRVRSDCDHTSVDEHVVSLRQQVAAAAPNTPLAIDLSDGRPTAVALQLAASAARSLGRKSSFAGFGENAARFLTPPFAD